MTEPANFEAPYMAVKEDDTRPRSVLLSRSPPSPRPCCSPGAATASALRARLYARYLWEKIGGRGWGGFVGGGFVLRGGVGRWDRAEPRAARQAGNECGTDPWKRPVTTSGVLPCFMSSSEAKRRRRLASTPWGCSDEAVPVAVERAVVAASATSLALTIGRSIDRHALLGWSGVGWSPEWGYLFIWARMRYTPTNINDGGRDRDDDVMAGSGTATCLL